MIGSTRFLAAIVLFVGAVLVLIPFVHSVGSSGRSNVVAEGAAGHFVVVADPAYQTRQMAVPTSKLDPADLHLVANH